jgi:transposase
MFKPKLEDKKLQQINKDLLDGSSLKIVAEKNDVSYQHVCYYRKKLVKAGVLTPLYEKRKTSRKKTTNFSVRKTLKKVTVPTPHTFKVVVNGTEVNISGAKYVHVHPDKLDVKY